MLCISTVGIEEDFFIRHIHNYTEYNSSEICALHLTHPSAHTRNSGQPTLRRPGSSWGFGALLNGLTSVVVLKVERTLVIHFPHWQFLPEPRFEPTTSGYKSDALSIRPRLVEIRYLLMFISRLDDRRFMCHLNNILGNTAICHNTLKSHKMVFVAGISFKKYTFWNVRLCVIPEVTCSLVCCCVVIFSLLCDVFFTAWEYDVAQWLVGHNNSNGWGGGG